MNAITVELSPSLREWVSARLADGDYVDIADYVRDLLRRDQAEVAHREDLRALIEEGLVSELDSRDPEDIIAAILAEDPDLRD